MTDHIGDPIPRGIAGDDAPLVDESLAARADAPSNEAENTLAALKAELETLKSNIADRQAETRAKVKHMVRGRPLASILTAAAFGYVVALLIHGGLHEDDSRSYWHRFR